MSTTSLYLVLVSSLQLLVSLEGAILVTAQQPPQVDPSPFKFNVTEIEAFSFKFSWKLRICDSEYTIFFFTEIWGSSLPRSISLDCRQSNHCLFNGNGNIKIVCPDGKCEISSADFPIFFGPETGMLTIEPCTNYTISISTSNNVFAQKIFQTKEVMPGAPVIGMQELAPDFLLPLTINWGPVTNPRCVAKFRVSWVTLSKGTRETSDNQCSYNWPSPTFISAADHIDVPSPGDRSVEINIVKGLACFPWYSVSVQAISHSGKLGKAAVVSREFTGHSVPDP